MILIKKVKDNFNYLHTDVGIEKLERHKTFNRKTTSYYASKKFNLDFRGFSSFTLTAPS